MENNNLKINMMYMNNNMPFNNTMNKNLGQINMDQNNIVNSELEKLAIKIHLAYDPEDTDLERYNLLEYNKRSSRASALHIKYKIYSILENDFTNNMKDNQKLFKERYTKEIEDLLVLNEHERWNAYMRSIGYVHASIEEVKSYYELTKHYIYYLARMHPSIVEFDKLDDISKEISKICNKSIDLLDNDRKIIRLLHEKIEL